MTQYFKQRNVYYSRLKGRKCIAIYIVVPRCNSPARPPVHTRMLIESINLLLYCSVCVTVGQPEWKAFINLCVKTIREYNTTSSVDTISGMRIKENIFFLCAVNKKADVSWPP